MMRIKLTIEYDGTPYAGWQRQRDARSVQQTLEEALFAFCQEPATLQCAGRTDAGVHATGQVAHADLVTERSDYQIMEGLNFYLIRAGEPIRILRCETVSTDFHARFSATKRCYHYRITNRRAPLALDATRAWHVGWTLNVEAMQRAAATMLGTHDFTSFRARACQSASPVKTLDRLEVIGNGEQIDIYTEAQSFLHHQVRNLVGSLMLVGSGKWQEKDMEQALLAKDRTASGPTAPACGLYLTSVRYNEA